MRQKHQRASSFNYNSDFVYEHRGFSFRNDNHSFNIQKELPSTQNNI